MRHVLAVAVFLASVACADGEPAATSTPRSFDRVERIEIDGRPSAVTVAAGRVFVADDENHEVHVIEASTGEVTEAIEVEGDPVAIAADNGFIWVAHAGGELTKIDASDATVEASKRIGGSLTDVIASDDMVWVIDLEGSAAQEIDPQTVEVRRGVTIPKGAVRGAVGKEGLWVSGIEDAISRVELVPFVVRHVYPGVGGGPIGLAWDGHVMWAAISDDGTVIDIEGKTHEDPIKVGNGPIALATEKNDLYVLNQVDETLVRIRGGEVRGSPVELDTSPRDIAIGDGAVWIAGTQSGSQRNANVVVRIEL